jgi:hypothetical protein
MYQKTQEQLQKKISDCQALKTSLSTKESENAQLVSSLERQIEINAERELKE